MSNQNDFVIENGVLKKYTGPGGDVVIPEGVTEIGRLAFDMKNLRSIVIPIGVTRIDDGAFKWCSLTSITIPEGVSSIGIEAFENCTSLEEITIPESLREVSRSAFVWCYNLKKVYINSIDSWCRVCFENENSNPLKNGASLFLKDECVEHLIIPDTISEIQNQSFINCRSIKDVTFPDGLQKIGKWAFMSCTGLSRITIPKSVLSIGTGAFSACNQLKSIYINGELTEISSSLFRDCSMLSTITIPETVTSIERCAFAGCSALSDVTLPLGVTRIGGGAFMQSGIRHIVIPPMVKVIESEIFGTFRGCSELSKVELPDGLSEIQYDAFSDCTHLQIITIPESLKVIGNGAFSGCSALKTINLPSDMDKIGDRAFAECQSLELLSFPNKVPSIGNAAFDKCTALCLQLPEGFAATTEKLPTTLAKASKLLSNKELAYVLVFQGAKAWREESMSAVKDRDKDKLLDEINNLLKQQKKIPSALASNSLEFCLGFASEISETGLREYCDLLKKSKCAKQLAVIEADPIVQQKLQSQEKAPDLENTPEKDTPSLILPNDKKPIEILDKLNETMGLTRKDLPSLLDNSQRTLPPFLLAWLLTAQEPGDDKLTIPSEVSAVIAMLDDDSWQTALVKIAEIASKFDGASKKTNLLFPVSRYASEKTMATLTSQAYRWGRKSQDIFHYACCYSDTRAAMLFAERHGKLDVYARMRGTDADTLRDTVLAEFGLDEDGTKVFDLGKGTIAVKLGDDLKLFLIDTQTNKTVKSIPKRIADPEKYEAAKTELALMKKNIRDAAKRRSDRLFEDFLSGAWCSAEKWQTLYLKNPVLNRVARLLVWEQEGRELHFTLSGSGIIDSERNPFLLTEDMIRLAHPMEMSSKEIKAWQSYFLSRGLKQPFLQIWEPVIDPKNLRADQFSGTHLSIYRFVGKEKHGITSYGLHDYSGDFGFTLADCRLSYKPSVEYYRRGVTDDAYYILGSFTYERYTRKVNHIVSLLYKWTIEDRIKADDSAAAALLDGFTLAQITEFTAVAQEAKSTNVLALLMEYKNTHFADFDPMDEFTLE